MVPLQESGRKEAHDARQDEHCPGSRVTVFLLQITEQETGMMKRRLTILALTTLAAVALIGVVWAAPSPALAEGATQISGDAFFPDPGECDDPPEGVVSDYAVVMTGDLEGCLYTDVKTAESSPSGTYRETGTELFVGSYSDGSGTFATTYRFEAKFEDVSGQLFFKDEVESGTFLYRGHLQY